MNLNLNQKKQLARKQFKNHKAVVLQQNDFLILDWYNPSGNGDYYIRYILDIARGTFIVEGNLGYSIASWNRMVSPNDLVGYLDVIPYYVRKLECSSDKYTYDQQDIDADLDAIKKTCLDNAADEDERQDIMEDFAEMKYLTSQTRLSEYCEYPDDLSNLFSKYDEVWFESDFARIGQRISQRVILWAEGFQMAMQQLKEAHPEWK